MDHFSGFDRLLRVCLGRDKGLRLYGPPGFIGKIEHRLASYEWNLVHNYKTDFTIEAMEIGVNATLIRALFRCSTGFRLESKEQRTITQGVLLADAGFRVRTAQLDHDIPSLAFSVEETSHVNVWKNRLAEMGLGVGPWLKDIKAAVMRGAPDDTDIRAVWREGGVLREAHCRLGALKEQAITVVAGQKLAYVVDALYCPANIDAIVTLARNADVLFIEAVFLEADAERAAARYHLTARQAGELARRAGVRRFVPFHFSPRYNDREHVLRWEAETAFAASMAGEGGHSALMRADREGAC
jgi:ribonuclease Z